MRREWRAMAAAVMAISAARADQLILEDGGVIIGAVTRTRDTYAVVTPRGQQFTFDKSDVKRAKYVSRVGPADAATLMAEYRELVMPALEVREPDQYISFTDEQTYGATSTFDAAAARFDASREFAHDHRRGSHFAARGRSVSGFSSQSSFDSRASTTVSRDKATDDVFVDEWVRYTAIFDALGADPRYRELANARRHADSLGDFARRAPDAFDAAADAVRDALDAVDECLDLAADTRRRMQALPLRALEHEEAIRQLENKLERQRARVRTAYNPYHQSRHVRRAEDRLRRRVARMDTELARAHRVAQRRINEFARAREIARRQIVAAEQQLMTLATTTP